MGWLARMRWIAQAIMVFTACVRITRRLKQLPPERFVHRHYNIFQVQVETDGGLQDMRGQFSMEGHIDRLAVPLEPSLPGFRTPERA